MKKIVKCVTVLALSLGISSAEAKISNAQFNKGAVLDDDNIIFLIQPI
jgi:hypothetical protein